MSDDETNEQLAGSIHKFIEDDLLMGQGIDFSSDDALLEEGIIDSLGLLEVVTFIETEFDISVDDAEVTLDNFGSVNAIAAFVKSSKNET